MTETTGKTLTRAERTKAIREACKGEVDPKKLAEKINACTTDEYSPIEQWLASNYLNALSLIDLYEFHLELLKEK